MNQSSPNQQPCYSAQHQHVNPQNKLQGFVAVQPQNLSNNNHEEMSGQREQANLAPGYSKQQSLQQEHSRVKDLKNQQEQLNYYNQFCRLYLTNTILTAQLKQLSLQKTQLVTKLNKIEKRAQELSEGNSGHVDEKKRRVRRSASEIARHYKCQVQGCNKSYGSQGSLNQHLKIKHVELFRTMNTNFLSNNGPVKESEQQDQSI